MNVPNSSHSPVRAGIDNTKAAESPKDSPSTKPRLPQSWAIVEWKEPKSLVDLMNQIQHECNLPKPAENRATKQWEAEQPIIQPETRLPFSSLFEAIMRPRYDQTEQQSQEPQDTPKAISTKLFEDGEVESDRCNIHTGDLESDQCDQPYEDFPEQDRRDDEPLSKALSNTYNGIINSSAATLSVESKVESAAALFPDSPPSDDRDEMPAFHRSDTDSRTSIVNESVLTAHDVAAAQQGSDVKASALQQTGLAADTTSTQPARSPGPTFSASVSENKPEPSSHHELQRTPTKKTPAMVVKGKRRRLRIGLSRSVRVKSLHPKHGGDGQ
eukprot:TRINITY_DN21936_c0_g1_i1.p1 TRINITY_DN21936_c0_g1~~TRINITY_DN21936_c0_g1_i1.p1  ORF type:complete len:328 (+),score=44.92 TRINITY_DN21936_c0_g1_i1:33-1016(+)